MVVMSITQEQKSLVQSTFKMVADNPDGVAALFYGHLFEIAPFVRSMFKGDMTEQGRKLMQIIGIAVASLDKLDSIIPAVQALGQRHVGYGVQREHYDVVGEALLWTLEEGLGEAFTPEVKDAWAAVYGTLVAVATENVYVTAEAAQ
jgi:hemoglobin-like flavoprotein